MSCCLIGKKIAGSKLAAQNVQPDGQNGGKIGQPAIQNGEEKQASRNKGKYWQCYGSLSHLYGPEINCLLY